MYLLARFSSSCCLLRLKNIIKSSLSRRNSVIIPQIKDLEATLETRKLQFCRCQQFKAEYLRQIIIKLPTQKISQKERKTQKNKQQKR
jgi:hypothetical protein